MREGQPKPVAAMLSRVAREAAEQERAQRERKLLWARLQLEQVHKLAQGFARSASQFPAAADEPTPAAHTSSNYVDMFGLDEFGQPR